MDQSAMAAQIAPAFRPRKATLRPVKSFPAFSFPFFLAEIPRKSATPQLYTCTPADRLLALFRCTRRSRRVKAQRCIALFQKPGPFQTPVSYFKLLLLAVFRDHQRIWRQQVSRGPAKDAQRRRIFRRSIVGG